MSVKKCTTFEHADWLSCQFVSQIEVIVNLQIDDDELKAFDQRFPTLEQMRLDAQASGDVTRMLVVQEILRELRDSLRTVTKWRDGDGNG